MRNELQSLSSISSRAMRGAPEFRLNASQNLLARKIRGIKPDGSKATADRATDLITKFLDIAMDGSPRLDSEELIDLCKHNQLNYSVIREKFYSRDEIFKMLLASNF